MEINKELLQAAMTMLNEGYTPENKGEYKKMQEREITPFTPANLKNVYNELIELFLIRE